MHDDVPQPGDGTGTGSGGQDRAEGAPPAVRRLLPLVAAALLVALVAGDAYHGGRAPVDYPDRPMAVLGDQVAPPAEEEPSPTDPAASWPPRIGTEPAWRFGVPDGVEPIDLATTADGFVLRTREQLVAVDQDGDLRWEYDLGETFHGAMVSDDVVLVSHTHPTDDRWPQPKVIVALDPATGETLWEEEEASFWAAFEGRVYMSVCYGGQNDRVGDCQFSARDPLTNTVRWSTPTYASAQVINDGVGLSTRNLPPYLVVESFPTGYASRTITTIDPGSGRQRGAGFDGHHRSAATPRTLISIDDGDDNPADGCTAELTGYDVDTGEEVWTYTSALAKTDDGTYCEGHPDHDATSGMLAVTNEVGEPEAIDADTGEVVSGAPLEGRGLGTGEGVLAVYVPTDGGGELVLHDTSSGDERWRAVLQPGGGEPTTVILDEMVLTFRASEYGELPVGYDLATGAAWSYVDSSAEADWSFGPGWIAVCEAGSCRGYELE